VIRSTVGKVISYIVLVAIALFGLAPFAILLLMSFKTRIQLLDGPFAISEINLATVQRNYNEVWNQRGFGHDLINSIIVSGASVLIALVLAVPAAYAISRFPFRGRETFGSTLVSFRFMPGVAVAIPIFLMVNQIALTDTYPGLILPYIGISLPLMIWILIGFFDEIPRELDDAGLVDGGSRLSVLWSIILPLMGPGLVVAAIFGLIFVWNEFLIGLFVINSNDMQTIPIGAAGLLSAQRPIAYNEAAVVGIVTTVPVFLFSLIAQRWIVRGITAGAVAG
jgi:ABC-type glycerol-3-phosphate transport system permease component